MQYKNLIPFINSLITKALKEDEAGRDITTHGLVSPSQRSHGRLLMKQDGVVCGLDIAKRVFRRLDRNFIFHAKHKDGDAVKKGEVLATFKGRTRAILSAERTALNFLSYLSGIATTTHDFVQAVKPYTTKILDTRKTTPGLRLLKRYAVRCGGGTNHRLHLYEMAMIKDNHILAAHNIGNIADIIRHLKRTTHKQIEVEVDTLKQLKTALTAHPDIILLDNMTPAQIRKAVAITRQSPYKRKPLLEASGGITLRNIKSYAKAGVDRISIGVLTHSHNAVDISLEMSPADNTRSAV